MLAYNPRVVQLHAAPNRSNVNFCEAMNLILYPRLGTRSRRALTRRSGKFGRRYTYRPKGHLLDRLSRETGLTVDAVRLQLEKERQYLLDRD